MPIRVSNFTIRVITTNPHRHGTDTWRAGLIIQAMEGCSVCTIISALKELESNLTAGIGDPARWITHFAGLESPGSGKNIKPWIEIIHCGETVTTTLRYREIVRQHVQ